MIFHYFKLLSGIISDLTKAFFTTTYINPIISWRYIRFLHFKTSGLSSSVLRLLVKTRPISNPHKRSVNTDLFQDNCIPLLQILNNLNTVGFSYVGTVNSNILPKLQDDIEKLTRYKDVLTSPSNSSQIPSFSSLEEARSSYFTDGIPTARLEYDRTMLYSSSYCRLFATDPYLKLIADTYLSCNSYLDLFIGWDSVFAHNSYPHLCSAAQYPHIDFKHLSFIKFFFFPYKVSHLDGPFELWPNSRLSLCKPNFKDGRRSRKFISSRLNTKPYRLTPSFDGAIYAVDTLNYHCDGVVDITGFRSCLQIEFTSNLFGAHSNYSTLSPKLSTYSLLDLSYQYV